MEEQIASSSFNTNSTSSNHPTIASQHSRFHFPASDHESSRPESPGERPQYSSLGLGHPISRVFNRTTSPAPRNGTDPPIFDLERRRIRSARPPEVQDMLPGVIRPRRTSETGGRLHRTAGHSRSARKDRRYGGTNAGIESLLDGVAGGTFSEEYDLSHEDPRILQDVQRALMLKARRDARIGSSNPHSPIKDTPLRSDVASVPSSSSGNSFPTRGTFPVANLDTLFILDSAQESSEIDFSPSVVPLHPVPLTSDDGSTLDWTSSLVEDEKSERRWTLSLTKKKGKEKSLPSSSILGQQATQYAEKLSRIKSAASPQTMRKASITRKQLQRRYELVYTSLESGHCLNLAHVARWFGNQDPIVQAALDKAEPLTWIKHVLDKRGAKTSYRLPWYLSALIVEEHFKAMQARPEAMETIPEIPSGDAISSAAISPLSKSTVPSSVPMRSRSSSRYSIGPSLSRRRSFEGHVSFEPFVDSGKSSFDGGHPSGDGDSKTPRHTTPGIDSSHSSIYSAMSGSSSHHTPFTGVSQAINRLRVQEFGNHMPELRPEDSDGASTSARDSLSEDNKRSDRSIDRTQRRRRHSRPGNLDLQSHLPVLDIDLAVDSSEQTKVGTESAGIDGPLTAKPIPQVVLSDEDGSLRNIDETTGASVERPGPMHRLVSRHRVRISLPSQRRKAQNILQQDVDEEMERLEYDAKAKLLNEAIGHNHRVRQILQRVAVGVREYEALHTKLMRSLGIPYSSLPQELLEAFSHDPSALTGSTRRLKDWKAVEDIHERVLRQREAFQTFLARAESDVVPIAGSVLDDPISVLLQTVATLETHQKAIAGKARDVVELLNCVKDLRAEVRSQYNETLSHTSLVYPELSHIIDLEESYRDNYQQFWEFGMDALTFLLDTVTPFWRNYGKTIGEDIQDFMIIPLYRNEYTGEAKRFPIKSLPRRSSSRWIGLFLFPVLSMATVFLQFRGAVSSSSCYRLPMITHAGLWWATIPFFWIGILIQWCAVIVEFLLVIAQLGVVAWWLGWSVGICS